jgi:hypothetical protein
MEHDRRGSNAHLMKLTATDRSEREINQLLALLRRR